MTCIVLLQVLSKPIAENRQIVEQSLQTYTYSKKLDGCYKIVTNTSWWASQKEHYATD